MTPLDEFGNIDIYVFDQLLRGRIVSGQRVFDAGCGGGRNLVYLLRQGFDVCGNDADPRAIAQVTAMAAAVSSASAAAGRSGETSPKLADIPGASDGGPGRAFDFRVEPIERTSFPDAHVDVVIASAVLHFAKDQRHFEAMLRQMWRVLKPGGMFFARLASTIGMESEVLMIGGGRSRLPDGSERFLVDAGGIEAWTSELGGTLMDPIKTTVVHKQRSMTTWVARKEVPGVP
jgi:tellurite methyltransferase